MPLSAQELITATLFLSASIIFDSPHTVCSLRLIARLPKFSHISSFMINQLHWLPLSAHLEFKILVLVLKSKLGVAQKYLMEHIRFTLPATSHRPLRFSEWQVLFIPLWPTLDPSRPLRPSFGMSHVLSSLI